MKIPFGVLNTPRKRQHMAELRKRMQTLRMAIQRKEAKIQALLSDAPLLNEDLSDDFVGIMRQPLYCFHFDFRYVMLNIYIYIYNVFLCVTTTMNLYLNLYCAKQRWPLLNVDN